MTTGWQRASGASPVLRFIDICLRGIGQAMFQNNPLSGLLFLTAIAWGSVVGGVPEVAIGGLVGVITGTLTAMWLRVDEKSFAAGLYGFNAFLVGLALPTFLEPSTALWAYIVIGSSVSVVAMLGVSSMLLTAPFVLVTWLLLLSANGFTGLLGTGPAPATEIVPIDPAIANPLDLADFIGGIFASVTQVFLKGHGPAALLLFMGLAVNSLNAAIFALFGALVSVIVAHLLGAESQLVTAGLLGFNSVLTAIALAAVFYQPSLRVVTYALLGTMLAVIVQGAMIVAMTPFGLPPLTAAFVLVTWLFLPPAPEIQDGGDPKADPEPPAAARL